MKQSSFLHIALSLVGSLTMCSACLSSTVKTAPTVVETPAEAAEPEPEPEPLFPSHLSGEWCSSPVQVAISEDISADCQATILLGVEFWRAVGVDYLTVVYAQPDELTPDEPMDGVMQVFGVRDLGKGILGVAQTHRPDGCISAAQVKLVSCELPVVAHELGHALGLRHVDDPSNLLYPAYTGRMGLFPWQKASVAR